MRFILFLFIIFLFFSCSDSTSSIQNCKNECDNIGIFFCENNRVYSCELDSNFCLIKKEYDNCQSKVCRDGVCLSSNCSDECYNYSESFCIDSSNQKICGDFDSDTCYEWKINKCLKNESCFNGECTPNENICEILNCSEKSICDANNGVCVCDQGYSGLDCSVCADGYISFGGDCIEPCRDNSDCQNGLFCDGEESCNLDNGICEKGDDISCNNHGECSNPLQKCVCEEGYIGENCEDCESGYQLKDGVCIKNCESNSDCSDSITCNGIEICNLELGVCEDSVSIDCGDHGDCLEPNGICDCETGWGGALCSVCNTGYHDENGVCIINCRSNTDCDDGNLCNGSEICLANGKCQINTTTMNCGNGVCIPTTGVCQCNSGWSGINCSICAANYYGLTCDECNDCNEFNARCDDGLSGTGDCICYQGYQDNDNNGYCLESCTLALQENHINCGLGSSCSDLTGEAVCVCDNYYYKKDNICNPIGNSCSDEFTTITETGSYTGDTALEGFSDDFRGSCTDTESNDTAFKLVLSKKSYVKLETVIDPRDSSFDDTVLYILDSCAGNELACNDDLDPNSLPNKSRLSRIETILEAGTYYIIVDGWSSNDGTNEGKFTLEVTITNQRCDIAGSSVCGNSGYCETTSGLCLYYKSCKELYDNTTIRVDGNYIISPTNRDPFSVYCYMNDSINGGGGWTAIANVKGKDSNAPFPGVSNVGLSINSTQYSINATGIPFNQIYLSHTGKNLNEIFNLKNSSIWSNGSNTRFRLSNDNYAIFKIEDNPLVCINSSNDDCTWQNSNVYGAISTGAGSCNSLRETSSNCDSGWNGKESSNPRWREQGGKILIK
ncbi:hypothetical protein JXR93_11375 [bacterium]|nr:hypothetical protein [bacterium]